MEVIGNMSKGQSADFIENIMKTVLEQQLNHEKNGNYKEAECCRLQFEQSRKSLEKRRLYEMEAKHKKENHDIEKAHQEELNHFNTFWEQKLEEYQTEGNRLVSELVIKHNSDIEKNREELDKKLTPEVKESSELLNLRKMEEHMAKQKKYHISQQSYVEAQRVQAKVQKLEHEEKATWIHSRNLKIETAINNLKVRQGNEMMALSKRISSGKDQQGRDRHMEDLRLKQKYENVCRDIKSQHDKEVLLFKGEFTSKGGSSGTGSPTKSKN